MKEAPSKRIWQPSQKKWKLGIKNIRRTELLHLSELTVKQSKCHPSPVGAIRLKRDKLRIKPGFKLGSKLGSEPGSTVAPKGQSLIGLSKHKIISQNANRFTKTQNKFTKTQINFPKHKSVYQKHKSISHDTNQFTKTQINFSKHKPVSWNTNQKTGHLLCDYQREPGRDTFPGFSASNMAIVSPCD